MGNARDGLEVFDRARRRSRVVSRQRRRRPTGQILLKFLTAIVAAVALFGVWVLVSSVVGDDPVSLRVESMDGGMPVVGAVIANEGGRTATSDPEGNAALVFTAPQQLTVTAHGYRGATFTVEEIPRQAPLTLTMQPYVLQGRVTDERSIGLVGATIAIDGKTTVSGEFGAFEINAVEPGPIVVSKSAWLTTETNWSGNGGRVDIALQPFVVRAVRVHHRTAGLADFQTLLQTIDGTVINGLVFDTKIEDGHVVHQVDNAVARGTRSVVEFYEPARVLRDAEARGLYAITRIVTFQDPVVAPQRPEWAVMDSATGGVWRNNAGHSWLDPTNREAWEYPIGLAVEACRMGFDEIQFDYVRFPSDGDISTAVYSAGQLSAEARVETIAEFLGSARERIHAEGCAVSADIFGIIASVANDQGIGQRVEELSWVTDVLSPMLYPSHYSPGWLGFDNPNNHPSGVVTQALDAGIPKLEGGAFIRPWLQAFAWNTEQVRESIQAAERAGVGWMLWNAVSAYDRAWLPLASGS